MDRRSRLIPELVFILEQFEQAVLQLEKKSKLNLTKHAKRSAMRDFRITVGNLMRANVGDTGSGSEEGASDEDAEGEVDDDENV
jgi:Fanconi anemia group I protein